MKDPRPPFGHPYQGEEIHSAKLTEDLVREIRRLHSEEGMGAMRIWHQMGKGPVKLTAIKRIVRGVTWKHVK